MKEISWGCNICKKEINILMIFVKMLVIYFEVLSFWIMFLCETFLLLPNLSQQGGALLSPEGMFFGIANLSCRYKLSSWALVCLKHLFLYLLKAVFVFAGIYKGTTGFGPVWKEHFLGPRQSVPIEFTVGSAAVEIQTNKGGRDQLITRTRSALPYYRAPPLHDSLPLKITRTKMMILHQGWE